MASNLNDSIIENLKVLNAMLEGKGAKDAEQMLQQVALRALRKPHEAVDYSRITKAFPTQEESTVKAAFEDGLLAALVHAAEEQSSEAEFGRAIAAVGFAADVLSVFQAQYGKEMLSIRAMAPLVAWAKTEAKAKRINGQLGDCFAGHALSFYDSKVQSLPAEIGRLSAGFPNLDRVEFWDIPVLPPQIGELTSVTQFVCGRKGEPQVIPVEIGQLRNLRWIIVEEQASVTIPLQALKELLQNEPECKVELKKDNRPLAKMIVLCAGDRKAELTRYQDLRVERAIELVEQQLAEVKDE